MAGCALLWGGMAEARSCGSYPCTLAGSFTQPLQVGAANPEVLNPNSGSVDASS